jgi:hypothetical protein
MTETEAHFEAGIEVETEAEPEAPRESPLIYEELESYMKKKECALDILYDA